MRRNVFCGDNLHVRFTALLSNASAVDIATAWATPGKHLRALDTAANRGVKVRAIVGISGNATHPDGPPTDERLVRIWKFRAALVDAFVCEPT